MSDIIAEKLPNVYKVLVSLYGEAMKPEKPDKKTKELIAIALSVAVRCEPCVKRHAESALKFGASEEEIAEALGVAVMMLGLPAYSWSRDTLTEFMKGK